MEKKKNEFLSSREFILFLAIIVSVAGASAALKGWKNLGGGHIPSLLQVTLMIITLFTGLTVALLVKIKPQNLTESDASKEGRGAWILLIPVALFSFFGMAILGVFSLLLIDLGHFFLGNSATIPGETRGILTKIYIGSFAILGFGVTTFVAWVRLRSLIQTQDQFQAQRDRAEIDEVEAKFRQGVEFLGNEDDTIKLGGVYILWELVERAAEIKESEPDEEKRTAVETKIFGMHKNILNILCGFLREHTNNPEYLAQNYPSLTKEYLFTHSDEVLKEAALLGKDEKPSNLIQETFNLLFQKRGSEINEKSTITFLNYKADLRGFIFRGGRLDNGCMNNVSLMNTDFSYCQINSSDMDVDSCKNITFFNTTLVNTQLRVSKDEPYSILIFINCELENPSFILPNGSLYLIFTSCVNFRTEQFKTNKLTIVDDLPMVYDFNEEQGYIRATTDHKEGDQYYYRGAFKYTFIRRELQREDIRNSAPLSKESLILIARFLWRDWEVLNSTKYQELSSLLVEEDHNVLEKNFIEYNRKGILDRRNDSEIDSPITHQNLKIDAQARACVYKFLLENGETIESLQSPQSAHSQEATIPQGS